MATQAEHYGHDLGLGDVLSRQGRQRLLNRDGSFNVQRTRRSLLEKLTYCNLLHMSWPRFLLSTVVFFLLSNAVFATLYLACGRGALQLNGPDIHVSRAAEAFFFSVHTFATIGFGNIVAVGLPANLLVTLESFYGLLSYALSTGLLFARFARPSARLRFGQLAVMTEEKDGERALHIRLTNTRRSEVLDVAGNLLLSKFDAAGMRRYYPLTLERAGVGFMPLAWTMVHKITAESPMAEMDAASLAASAGEILVHVNAVDELSSQTIYARISYMGEEIRWGARFADMYVRDEEDRLMGVDLQRFDQVVLLD